MGCTIVSVVFDDLGQLRELVGEFGSNLKVIAKGMGVDLEQRGNAVHITRGDAPATERLLRDLERLISRGFPLTPSDVEHAIRLAKAHPEADLTQFFSDAILMGAGGRPIAARTPTQRRYVQALRESPIVFGVGPAGTGKTYLAMAMAVAALGKGEVRRIVLTRPAVEAGEKLGFLPGDLSEKIDPYLRPLFDALQDMMSGEKITKLLDKRVIEVAPLAFMRGRTLQDAYVILDEAQNTTVEQMKMFLTRLGEHSRMIITGDPTQIDLPRPRMSGLVHALRVLKDVPNIEVVRFQSSDVVRHPLVAAIIDAYSQFEDAGDTP